MEPNGLEHGQCLSEETLTEYLAGSLDLVVTAACEVHLIACDRCRESLALYMRVLAEESSPQEVEAIDRAVQNWQQNAGAIVTAPRRNVSGIKKWVLSMAGLAAVVALATLSWTFFDRPGQPTTGAEVVQLLLAQERRFELRLGDQPYAPIVRTRGGSEPDLDYGLLAGEMTRLAADSYAMGRFYLLQGQFDRAISFLEDAERQPRASAAVHNDLGVAYLESGGQNLAKAAEEFSHALSSDPAFSAAVFNLAIFHERMGTLSQAEVHWRRYLQFDSTSGWADEVRSKLEVVNR